MNNFFLIVSGLMDLILIIAGITLLFQNLPNLTAVIIVIIYALVSYQATKIAIEEGWFRG